MLALCYEKTGRPNKLQDVLEEIARTYPDDTQAAEKLQILKQNPQSK